MQRLNLLFVITKLELGGAQKQLLELIRHLDQARFTPFLFTASTGLLLPEAQAIKGLTLKKSRCLERSINPLKDLCAFIEIYRFIKKNRITAIHTHSSKAGILGRLAGRMAGVKVIVHTVHGWSFNSFQPCWRRLLFVRLERFAARFTTMLVVVCLHDLDKGLAHGIAGASRYRLIRYGIRRQDFTLQRGSLRQELGIAEGVPLVGMVACLKPQKAPQDFIRLAWLTLRTVPSAHFVLIGDGVLRARLQRQIARRGLGGRVTLCGWRTDMPRILADFDVFVLTSLWEGLPVAALEAMACGKPVLATRTGGIEEVVVEGKAGYLVDPGDTEALAMRLASVLGDESLRTRLGQYARLCLREEFDTSYMAGRTQALYEELAGGSAINGN